MRICDIVSDVFHTGSPDSPMWEFKHGNGNFRKGDVAGLREIKRRASRHTLINRDSFSGHNKPSASQPGTPAEAFADGPDIKVQHLEHTLYDVHARLARMEDNHASLSSKCQALTESLVRCHQVRHLDPPEKDNGVLLITGAPVDHFNVSLHHVAGA